MKAIADLLVHTLAPVLYVLLLGGAVLGLVVGILLLFDSARVMRWNAVLNRWYSTRQAMRSLERPIDIKRPFYRWHRLVGVVESVWGQRPCQSKVSQTAAAGGPWR